MLSIQEVSKSYGAQVLLDDATLQLNARERLGLIGRNGYGKSTLFRMILKEEDPDSGLISIPRNYRIGHLAQHLHFTKPTILEEACLGLQPDEEHDHYKAERILFGLGFTAADMERAPAEFSGGFQIRLNLAKLLVSNPNMLLLDEPTNYLDIVSIRWITQFLRNWKGELILISHDRDFMDSVTTHTAIIHRQKIKKVEGNIQKLYDLIEQEETTHEQTRVNQEKQRKHAEAFINRFKASAARASLVQSRMKLLDKMPVNTRLQDEESLEFDFQPAPFEAKVLMEVNDVGFGYTPDHLLFQNLNLIVNNGDRIGIIGKNGKGKSTFLNVLAGELTPLQGSVRFHPLTKLAYFGQTNISRLKPNLTVEDEVSSANLKLGKTAVRSICGQMMFSGDLAEKRVSALSGGEKSRVMLGKILATPSNLLFLDEPTNHLDMPSILALTESILNFEGGVLLVTHSEEILRSVVNKLIIFQHDQVEFFPGTYDEFLDRIGWEEEDNKKKGSKKTVTVSAHQSAPQKDDKELKRLKAELTAKQSQILTPLKKESTHLEKEIEKLEAELGEANHSLLKASQDQNRDFIVFYSKKVKDLQSQIDQKFSRLEEVSHQITAKTKECELEMMELVG